MEAWIRDLLIIYSYWAIVVLVAVEGDVTLLVAGMLAHEQMLGFGLLTAIIAAMAGAVGGDIFAFMLGRRVRPSISEWKIYQKCNPRLEWMEKKFGFWSIILVKWLYGMRFASSMLWGVSRMSAWRFAILTLFSCGVWVTVLTTIGWLFGTAVTSLLTRFQSMAVVLIFTIVGLIAMRFLHHWWITPHLQHEAEMAGLTRDLQAESAPIVSVEDNPIDAVNPDELAVSGVVKRPPAESSPGAEAADDQAVPPEDARVQV